MVWKFSGFLEHYWLRLITITSQRQYMVDGCTCKQAQTCTLITVRIL